MRPWLRMRAAWVAFGQVCVVCCLSVASRKIDNGHQPGTEDLLSDRREGRLLWEFRSVAGTYYKYVFCPIICKEQFSLGSSR